MNRKAKSLLSAVITGGILMTYGGVVFATSGDSTGTTTTTTTTTTKQTHVGPGGQGPMLLENDSEEMKTMLAALVTDDTLTQANVDSMTAFMATEKADREAEQAKVAAMNDTERKAYHDQKATTTPEPKADMFSTMVTNGILTQAQVDTIKAKNEAQKLATRQAEQATHLKTLVASNIITDAQVDKILAYEVTQDAARKTEMAKEQAMTTEEREAYHEANKKAPIDLMSGLVEAGIITQAQADSIKAQDEAQRLTTRQAEQTTQLNTLVASNTITAAQVDKILAYEVTQDTARKADMAKEQAMTTEEREAYHKTAKEAPKAPLSGLVDDGILTQAQADAVAKVMGPVPPAGHLAGPVDHAQKK